MLKVAQRAMERAMLGISFVIESEVTDIARRWAGHIARRTDGRWGGEVLEWRPRTRRRSVGRPRTRSREADGWRSLGEAYAQQWASPDGMSLIPWKMVRVLVWDATCSDTLAPSHLHGTNNRAGAACEATKKAKACKYRSLGSEYDFVPFGVETLGPWGPSAMRFFKEIAKRLVDITGDRRAGSYLGQNISLAIQRGNAASVFGTLPKGTPFNKVRYQRAMERSILGYRRGDKKRATDIRKRTKLEDVIRKSRQLKWKWAGHVTRDEIGKWTRKTTEWVPRTNIYRKRGRQLKRWMT
ncbi:hypothetical protein evm_002319 [Chilo suppressalis]|nr:hypothetical protein evm_002319 [Chilo suppressalis]